MRKLILYFILINIVLTGKLFSQPIIIDHKCTNVANIPTSYIEIAKKIYVVSYGHTSHGSQVVTGMKMLMALYPYLNFNEGKNYLVLKDNTPSGDLGNPDRVSWAHRTREMLHQPDNNVNVVMWSWCGQVSDATEEDINTYLQLMNELEIEFPNVKFVYMTGHLDGTGIDGNLHQRNEQIRRYCKENKKILFDFADIESYDPSGNFFLDKFADDACNYWENGEQKNWAEEWCAKNPDKCFDCEKYGGCAHSHCLNCWQKGNAFWWMMARLAGWQPIVDKVEEDTITCADKFILYPNYPNPVTEKTTTIRFCNPKEQKVKLEIFDINGNLVLVPFEKSFPKGEIHESIDLRVLPIGAYEYRLTAGEESKTGSLRIVR